MEAVAARSICAEGITLMPAGILSMGSSLPATGDILTSTFVTGAGGGGAGAAATGPGDGDAGGAGETAGGAVTGSVLAAAGGGREAFFFGGFFGATTSICGKTGAFGAAAGLSGLGAGGSAVDGVSLGPCAWPRAASARATLAKIAARLRLEIRIRPPRKHL